VLVLPTPSSSSSSQQHEGSTFAQNATQVDHLQIDLALASSSERLNIQHYQPIQQAQTPSQGPQKRATKNGNTVPAPDVSMSQASEEMPTTFAGIMSQFRLTETPHSAGG